jgi:hypothetical protein
LNAADGAERGHEPERGAHSRESLGDLDQEGAKSPTLAYEEEFADL